MMNDNHYLAIVRRTEPRPAYLDALLQAKLDGHYVPEIEDVYFRHEDFRTPHALALDLGH